MRKAAFAIAALLVLWTVAPAFSQPFADVPTDHWAFDAIAELAAKGIVEGYPDGTFKGDRAMTRYEMAMVVARLLARVEAIKIPAPTPPAKVPPPEVGRADIQTLQRLVNEFRAELAALGVRVTAVEEELAALQARLDNTRVTGNSIIVYGMESGSPASIVMRNRVQFSGTVGSVSAVTRLRVGYFAFGSGMTGFVPSGGGLPDPGMHTAQFDLAYLEWNAPFGVNLRVGRQLFTLGANGLLFDSDIVPGDYVDGARAAMSFGPLALTTALYRDILATPDQDLLSVSAGFNLLPGWTTNAHLYQQRPITAATSTGFGFDLSGNIIPGVSFALDYATFDPAGAPVSSSAWRADLTFDLGRMMGMTGLAPTLKLSYKDYGAAGATGPAFNNAETEEFGSFNWDMRAFYARLDLRLASAWTANASFENGTVKSTGASFSEWHFGAQYTLSRGATVDIYYDRQDLAGATGTPSYTVEVNYRW